MKACDRCEKKLNGGYDKGIHVLAEYNDCRRDLCDNCLDLVLQVIDNGAKVIPPKGFK